MAFSAVPKKLTERDPGRGLLRVVFRLPLVLYGAHLGWLLGNRFLRLTHTGRKSGLPRQTVLEVVRHDKATNTYVIASAWGEKANWFQNIQRTPEVMINAGVRRIGATAERLSVDEAEREIRDYARRHPLAFRNLARMIVGRRPTGTDDDFQLFAESVPLVALSPHPSPSAHEDGC